MGLTRDRSPTRLVIADCRRRARRALRALLATYPEFVVVGEAADGEEAVACVKGLRPDLVLLDVWMPRLRGIATVTKIKTYDPSIRVVVHSLAVDRCEEAIAAGADAFVPKGAPVR